MKALTYSQIISILEDIARRSYKINSFFLGQDWELAQSEAPVYPCLQVYPLTSVMPISVMGDYKSVVFEIQCKLLDLVGHDQFNQKSVHNDLHAVAQSIVNEINQNPYFVRSFVKMVGDVQFVNLEEVNDDFLAGWGWVIRLEVRNLNTFCGQAFEPVDGYSMSGPSSSGYSPSVRYLTCDTVTGCTTFHDYIQNAIDGVVTDNYYTTGGTLVGTTIQFDRNDLLNAYEVQLSGLTSGITATGAYLNLSGGTVTGNTNFTVSLTANSISATTLFVTNESWTIELVDALTAVFYAPYAMQINSITNILNSPSIAIYDDGALYTLTNTIATGSKILVSANTASVVSLNATK